MKHKNKMQKQPSRNPHIQKQCQDYETNAKNAKKIPKNAKK